jgi:adenylate cyclase
MGSLGAPKPRDDGKTEWAHLLWHSYLTGDVSRLDGRVRMARRMFLHLPSPPRCRVCNAPFRGMGGALARVFGFGVGTSRFNPTLCGRCDHIVTRYQAGVELPITMLFADIRGSTSLAERIGASEYHRLINRFYQVSTDVLVRTDALIDKLVGDQVIGIYVPGIAGPDYTRKAVEAAKQLLLATGHADPGGPWIQVGAGVHSGPAYVGAVGSSDSMSDITVLGDAVNTTARLSSQAGPGEILVSEDVCRSVNLDPENRELRTLTLKGRSEPVGVRVIRIGPAPATNVS